MAKQTTRKTSAKKPTTDKGMYRIAGSDYYYSLDISTENTVMAERLTRSRRSKAGQGGVERLQRDADRISNNPEPNRPNPIPEGTAVNPLAPPPVTQKRKRVQVCFQLSSRFLLILNLLRRLLRASFRLSLNLP